MAMRLRLQPVLETIQEFELAAEERYWTGIELMMRGDGATGIYLMGYAAEMLLKNSYFLLDLLTTPTFPVGSQLALAKNAAKNNFLPQYLFTNYHDLIFWSLLLTEKRRQEGRPLLPQIELALTQPESWVENRALAAHLL